MKTLDDTVSALVHGFLWLGSRFYNIKADRLPEKAVIAARHQSSEDILLFMSILPKKTKILASKDQLVNKLPVINYWAPYVLRVSGIAKSYDAGGRPRLNKDVLNVINDFVAETLQAGYGVAYAPEGRISPGKVGQNINPGPIIKAASLGYDAYVVGVHYRNEKHPWLSFLKLPWQNGAEVRFEPIYAKEKTRAEVMAEMRIALIRLSRPEPNSESR